MRRHGADGIKRESEYLGVGRCGKTGRWRIRIGGRLSQKQYPPQDDEEDAARIYDTLARTVRTPFQGPTV